MTNNNKICFIVEGVKTEPIFIKNLARVVFKDAELIPLVFSTIGTIYSLYLKMIFRRMCLM